MKLDSVLVKKIQETKDVFSFRFACNLDFKPGQYILLELDVEDPNGNDRPFTISSSPLEKGYVEITTKIIEASSLFKKKLAKMELGNKGTITGPLGSFLLQEDYKNHVMIAGGIGITPFRSMIKYAIESKLKENIILLYSNKTPEEIAFKKELDDLQKKNKNLCVIHTITGDPGNWKGETGRIDEHFIKKHVPNIEESIFYICGSPPMVDAMFNLLKNMQIPQEKIKLERFIGY